MKSSSEEQGCVTCCFGPDLSSRLGAAGHQVMDNFNRPSSIAEDTIHYSIYPQADTSDRASVTALATCISDFVNSALPDFIWHRDPFEVKVVSNPENSGSWILEGRIRVGDCIDDEWCTVWLLKEISSKWDTIIRCVCFCLPILP